MNKKDEALFVESVFDEFALSAKAMAKYILKSDKSAGKAVYLTFGKIVKHRKLFDRVEQEDIRRLVIVFLRCACFEILRRERGLEYSDQAEVPENVSGGNSGDGGDMLAELLKKEKLRWFKDTFISFGSPFKEICILKFYYNMESASVADILGLKTAEVNAVLCKWLAKLKTETDFYLGGSISPAEMGVAIGLVCRQYIDDEAERLVRFDVSHVSVSSKIKRRILKKLKMERLKPWLILGSAILLLIIAAIVFLIFM